MKTNKNSVPFYSSSMARLVAWVNLSLFLILMVWACLALMGGAIKASYGQNNLNKTDLKIAGRITAINGVAQRTTLAGEVFQLSQDDVIYENDLILTKDNASVKIRFTDNTLFALSENSSFKIDRYVYEEDIGSGNSLFNIVRGKFLYVSGIIARTNPLSAKIDSSVAAIGIRGTVISGDILVGNDGKFDISLIEGQIEIDVFGEDEPVIIADNFVNVNGVLEPDGLVNLNIERLPSDDIIRRDLVQFSLLTRQEVIEVETAVKQSLIAAGREGEADRFNLSRAIIEAIEFNPPEVKRPDIDNDKSTDEDTMERKEDFVYRLTDFYNDNNRQITKPIYAEDPPDDEINDRQTTETIEEKGSLIAYAGTISFMSIPAILSLNEADTADQLAIGDRLELSQTNGDYVKQGAIKVSDVKNNDGFNTYNFTRFGRWQAENNTTIHANSADHVISNEQGWWVRGARSYNFPLSGSADYTGGLSGNFETGGAVYYDDVKPDSTITLNVNFAELPNPELDATFAIKLEHGADFSRVIPDIVINASDLAAGGGSFEKVGIDSIIGEFYGIPGEILSEAGGSFQIAGGGGTVNGIFTAKKQ